MIFIPMSTNVPRDKRKVSDPWHRRHRELYFTSVCVGTKLKPTAKVLYALIVLREGHIKTHTPRIYKCNFMCA